ncbi:MAG: UDP-glucose/GDP-mannose dehydrogenase family protein [Pseudomonadales bacterium]
MRVVIVGSGYVGLVTGACFAEMGNHVVCVDINAERVAQMQRGECPIYEPGLEQLLSNNIEAGLLSFTTDLNAALVDAEFAFIAVGTPSGADGSADLTAVLAVADDIGRNMHGYLVVVDKSTVPVGTAEKVQARIQAAVDKRGEPLEFDVISNPEFLKEGSAIQDFVRPDRVVVGTDSERAKEQIGRLYAPFVRNHDRILYMGVRDAEMTKYAGNAMLATKISFMNEIADLCDQLDVDVEQVRLGIGSDNRIGFSFIYPGAGYGGSCFPKDVKAVISMARDAGADASVLSAVEHRNQLQKHRLFEKISDRFDGDFEDKTIAVWGLSFKPGTDDMREAPSVVLITALLQAGAKVVAYDPVAIEAAREYFDEQWFSSGALTFVSYQYDALKQVDALALMTEWKRFRQPDFPAMLELMSEPLIFDGRNQFEPEMLAELGFEYFAIGRNNLKWINK